MGTKVGTNYHPSTLVQLPAKGNKWFVVVTLPKALQNTKNLRVRKSTGTTDRKIAKGLQHQITQKIYAGFDAALKPTPATLLQLCEEHWPLNEFEDTTHQELIDGSDGGNLWAAMQVWKHSGRNEEVAVQLFEYLDRTEAEIFRNNITPKVYVDPYPASSSRRQQSSQDEQEEGGNAEARPLDMSTAGLAALYIENRIWPRLKTKEAADRYLTKFVALPAPHNIGDVKKIHAYRFADKLQEDGYAQKTIKSALSAVSAFLTDCEKRGYIEATPFVDLKLSGYGRTSVSYKPMSRTQLQTLFSLNMKPMDRLCLSILATTGMRLDEVALLEYRQIKDHQSGFRYIDLKGGIVKNTNSERFVPLRSEIKIETAATGRIFDYKVGKDGKAEGDASKRLMRIIRLVTDDPQIVIHSLRGSFKDMLREAGVSKEMNDFITGHGQGDTASSYGSGPSIKARYDAVSLLDFSFLGLSHA